MLWRTEWPEISPVVIAIPRVRASQGAAEAAMARAGAATEGESMPRRVAYSTSPVGKTAGAGAGSAGVPSGAGVQGTVGLTPASIPRYPRAAPSTGGGVGIAVASGRKQFGVQFGGGGGGGSGGVANSVASGSPSVGVLSMAFNLGERGFLSREQTLLLMLRGRCSG